MIRGWSTELLLAALGLSLLLSVSYGGSGFGWALPTGSAATILLSVRLPRVLTAALVGAALGGSGAALQGMFRNPLADPAILGVSSAAALFAQITIFLGWSLLAPYCLPIAATAGAVVATLALLRLVEASSRGSMELLILGGVALGQIALAASALLTSLALRDFTTAQRLIAWMLGSLDGRTWMHVFWGLGPIASALVWLRLRARSLDALTLGEATARSLGVDVRRLQREIVLACALLSGIAVALAGVVAFVGLLAPHWGRAFGARCHAELVPQSAAIGALLVVLADWFGRILIAPAELQIGVVTAALGAPWLFMMLRTRAKEILR